jgi:DNA invertase Pin-like site-specific DNA recombinase
MTFDNDCDEMGAISREPNLNIIGAMAEFVRALIQERVKTGFGMRGQRANALVARESSLMFWS